MSYENSSNVRAISRLNRMVIKRDEKIAKLKELLLLTDKSVWNIIVSDTQLRQWREFIKTFPCEGGNERETTKGETTIGIKEI